MGSSLTYVGMFVPNTVAELYGSAAFIAHLLGYWIYAKQVMQEKIQPNVATWLMWLFGGVVEFLTYDAIPGSHWSTSALPFACMVGVGAICVSMAVTQLRNGTNKIYTAPIKSDYYLLGFDASAGILLILGINPVLANIIAVSTSFTTFQPTWRAVKSNPDSENQIPWLVWCSAYALMTLAVAFGDSGTEIGLYFYPIFYLILHAIVPVMINFANRKD